MILTPTPGWTAGAPLGTDIGAAPPPCQAQAWQAALEQVGAQSDGLSFSGPAVVLSVQQLRHARPIDTAGDAGAQPSAFAAAAQRVAASRQAGVLRAAAATHAMQAQPGAPGTSGATATHAACAAPGCTGLQHVGAAGPAPEGSEARLTTRLVTLAASFAPGTAQATVVAHQAAGPPRPQAAPSRPPEPAPMRLHAQFGAAGVVVWAGIDGDAAAVALRAATLLADLRRAFAASPLRLGALVCNGTTVHGPAPPSNHDEEQ